MTEQESTAAAARVAYEGARALAERDAAHRAHTERLLLACADALDACDRLLAAGPQRDPAAYRRTVRLIAGQLEAAATGAGLEPLGAVGERADPATHHVVGVRPAPAGTVDDEVLEVARRGYRYRGHVLRAARVVVAAGDAAEERTQAAQEGTAQG
ncbi:nucleotide exchange factor GrpE [Streptomyces sp. MNP-20]|uniref:nucleotide exchange factor GrpE n=1 Tax=Streptomyces sp. MNP-20 TaxID=2721165 RepID=UPI001555DDDE|nr:nucleotide exchange factor GrpE [Streptomyces sp. MNP-20]